ncbi:hypothetical protein MLD38_036880 [Melastoma candidum]|uniref:Uncharacterized protein n=1 Tax=Melastoma candidum TaxID=119954 RepID=A0ACB9LL39_9MYRT|nr:hypothetical protein MLD38_036880 [Melastoma candidum]
MEEEKIRIAILGAGIFVKTHYIPRLAEISDIVDVGAIWSRSEVSARGAVELARRHFPGVECKWGDGGLDEIIQDNSLPAVAVVLPGQVQADISLGLLKAGKHVLQEKPASASYSEIEKALTSYHSICANSSSRPIWAVAENYRFEPVFVEGKKLVADIGDIMSVQLIFEGSVNSSNPYFSSSWRRDFTGGFILDMGVHYIAGLRMLVGCELTSVSATTTHVDLTLPPPDTITSSFQLENGSSGVFVMVISSRSPKIFWRVVGLKGTLQIERGNQDGYLSTYCSADRTTSTFYPFRGVTEELKAFLKDVSNARKKGNLYEPETRCSFIEGARDVAVLDAMLESAAKHGEPVNIKKL